MYICTFYYIKIKPQQQQQKKEKQFLLLKIELNIAKMSTIWYTEQVTCI